MLNKTARDIRWRQDLNTLDVDLEIKRTTIKKITVTVGKRFLRVTCPEKSYAKIIDLFGTVIVDPSVPVSTDYNGEILTVHLKKSPPKLWDGLWVEGITKEELQARREEDIKELETLQSQRYEQKMQLRIDHSSLVTKEKMRIDENKQQFIENKKEEEKKEALSRIFNEEQETKKEIKASKKENEIWGDEDVEEEQEKKQKVKVLSNRDKVREGDLENEMEESHAPVVQKTLPAIRNPTQSEPVKLEFTERIFPTLAMRESHIKEAPAPKLRKLAQKMDKVESNYQEPREHNKKSNMAER